MHATAIHRLRVAPSAAAARAIAHVFVDEHTCDVPLVSIPRPEIHIVVRFGPSARNGLDAYAFGARHNVRRKLIPAGQRVVTARLRLGAPEAVLGVTASSLAGRMVELDELWGAGATRRFFDRLATARDTVEAAAIVEAAIAERLAYASERRAPLQLALEAAEKLAYANVNAVASELGVSERHLRRVFRDVVGVSPKAFAKLARFHRALDAARERHRASWASIAVATGYYDQAHLIDEFRAIAGVTPSALIGERSAWR